MGLVMEDASFEEVICVRVLVSSLARWTILML